jgi:hypothetical protein
MKVKFLSIQESVSSKKFQQGAANLEVDPNT